MCNYFKFLSDFNETPMAYPPTFSTLFLAIAQISKFGVPSANELAIVATIFILIFYYIIY